MAKYRHRTFEMYDFRDEAILALTPKSENLSMPAAPQESRSFEHLAVSRSASVTHVEFKSAQTFENESASNLRDDLRDDLAQLADCLERHSKVLLNFAGVQSFSVASINELVLFNQKLRTKGSRLALCCLDSETRKSFFVRRSITQ